MTHITDISQYINLNSRKIGKKTAVVFQNKKISYAKLEKIISILSISLKRLGISEGDKIGVALSNCLEFVYILFAAARIGATIVPYNMSIPVETMKKNFQYTRIKYLIGWHRVIDELFKKKNIEKIIKKSKTIVVGASSKKFISFDSLINNKHYAIKTMNSKNLLNKNYIIALTSGSTGDPKPIILSQKTKILRSLHTKDLYNLNRKSVVIASTPLYHTLAQRLIILPIMMGGTSVILSGFSIKKWCREVKKNKVTFSILVSSQLENLVNYNKNIFNKLKSLKTLVSSSATLEKSAKEKIEKLKFPKFFEIYGTSEIANITNIRINQKLKKINSVGKECKFASIKIINDKNKFQKVGEPGEIICKTPAIFSGYLKKPRETKLSFYNGYFKTGDLGYLDKDKHLYFISRKKNIIIVGGINVYPEDIEKCLKKNYQIKQCCVFGIKDQILGEKVIAAIISSKKIINEVELRKYCLKNLADFQQPHTFFSVKKFPRNSLGKIKKNDLKKDFLLSVKNTSIN